MIDYKDDLSLEVEVCGCRRTLTVAELGSRQPLPVESEYPVGRQKEQRGVSRGMWWLWKPPC